jgi:hypothetical protein
MLLTVPGTCCCAIFAKAECNGNWEEVQQCYIMLCLPWTSGLWQRRTLTHNGASGSNIQEFYTLTFNWLGHNDVLVSGQASPHMQDLLASEAEEMKHPSETKSWTWRSQGLMESKSNPTQWNQRPMKSKSKPCTSMWNIEISDLHEACNVAC